MNGNTADLYRMPLDGGGGTVCLIPIAWPFDACRFAGGSHSRAVVSSLTLDRYEGAGANAPQSGVKVVLGSARTRAVAQQSRAEQSRAEQSI